MTEPRHDWFAEDVSRRTFLRRGFIAAAFATVGVLSVRNTAGAEEPQINDGDGVLVDLTRCIGCRACENACLIRQGFEGLPSATFGYGAGDGHLSFRTRTFVDFPEVSTDGGKRRLPVKRQCMHCLEPACVSVCPVAALEKTPRGPVLYREDRCIGCRYCILACPFSVPRYEWDNALTPRVNKCDLCDDRIAAGLLPACVAACPTGTLKFGKRESLLQEARARIASQPKRYATLFGDAVVGGTSWIYLSDTPIEQLGFPKDLPAKPMPELTWKVISKLPFVVIGVGLLLSGIFRWRSRGVAHE